MCDSTNAERPGFTQSEKSVGKVLDGIFEDHRKNRIIIARFASNVDRVQQIINCAEKYGRKVAIEGRSMVNIISIASELGYLSLPDNILIDVEQLRSYPDEQTVIITTGSQGESMAALSRMANGTHRKVSIKPNDTIVFSSNPIPGNEKSVTGIINELMMKGCRRYISGCPCFRTCLPGGDQAYLFSCQSKVRNPCSWRVQASCGTGQNSRAARI